MTIKHIERRIIDKQNELDQKGDECVRLFEQINGLKEALLLAKKK